MGQEQATLKRRFRQGGFYVTRSHTGSVTYLSPVPENQQDEENNSKNIAERTMKEIQPKNLNKSLTLPARSSRKLPPRKTRTTNPRPTDINFQRQKSFVDLNPMDRTKVEHVLNRLLSSQDDENYDAKRRFQRSASIAEFEPLNGKKTKVIQEISLIKRIGSGSFGSVWKAENLKTQKTIAVKRMIGNSFHEQLSFLREAEILKLSNHPNVLKFLGLYVKKGSLEVENMEEVSPGALNENLEPGWVVYLCTEYCRYRNLTHLLRNKNVKYIPWNVRIKLSLDIAKGVNHLHSLKVIHRDLKSENILLKPLKRARMRNLDHEMKKWKHKKELKEIRREHKKYRGLGLRLGEEINLEKSGTKTLRKLKSRRSNAFRSFLTQKNSRKYHYNRKNHDGASSVASSQDLSSTDSSDSDTDSDFWSDEEHPDHTQQPKYSTRHWERVLNSRAIVADVGLARFFKASLAKKEKGNNLEFIQKQRQERLTIRGNPWTMAPELLRNPSMTSYTTACDIFSLGVVFLEICTRLKAADLPRAGDFSLDFKEFEELPVELKENSDEQEDGMDSAQTKLISSESLGSRIQRPSGESYLFKDCCPEKFKQLAADCVKMAPEHRPSSSEIVKRLQIILKEYNKETHKSKEPTLTEKKSIQLENPSI
eukprot:maker-scaffold_1-snap-gene-26.51-mRNA-1 protein AED:0.00 eAED:0.00 QI:242/1/1/1/1/1/2/441/650